MTLDSSSSYALLLPKVRTSDGLLHELRIGERNCKQLLNPWNHAPLQVPSSSLDPISQWLQNSLSSQHSHTKDALTGKKLAVLDQCVAMTAEGNESLQEAQVTDVHSLHKWLQNVMTLRESGDDTTETLHVLITAPPAAGKTTLMSQLMMLCLMDKTTAMTPILMRASRLQKLLLESPEQFANSWNWVDAFVSVECEPDLHSVYRQALTSRHALILLDGLDEGGLKRQDIEKHLIGTLGPQGHLVVSTSRPNGVGEALLASSHRLELTPLTTSQQLTLLEQRFNSKTKAESVLRYVESTMPKDPDSNELMTANPLMLSMIASVSEMRAGVDMPSSKAELYALATSTMLGRSGISDELFALLRAVFLHAHINQKRIITSDDSPAYGCPVHVVRIAEMALLCGCACRIRQSPLRRKRTEV